MNTWTECISENLGHRDAIAFVFEDGQLRFSQIAPFAVSGAQVEIKMTCISLIHGEHVFLTNCHVSTAERTLTGRSNVNLVVGPEHTSLLLVRVLDLSRVLIRLVIDHFLGEYLDAIQVIVVGCDFAVMQVGTRAGSSVWQDEGEEQELKKDLHGKLKNDDGPAVKTNIRRALLGANAEYQRNIS